MSGSEMRTAAYGPLPADTTEDVRARGAGAAVQVAVLPVGSFEQHGPYLPLATDTLVACAIAREIAEAYPVHLLPPVTIACSHEHAAWPGTVSISSVTLHAVVRDIAASLRRSGVEALVLVNGHGGNYVLGNAVQESSARGERMALFPAPEDWEAARERSGVETSLLTDMHAGRSRPRSCCTPIPNSSGPAMSPPISSRTTVAICSRWECPPIPIRASSAVLPWGRRKRGRNSWRASRIPSGRISRC